MDSNMAVAHNPAMANVLDQPTTVLAGRGRRFGTFLIDYFCYIVLCLLVGVALGLVLGNWAVALFAGGAGYIFAFAVFFAFYGVFEGLWARTPGKFLLGTVVVNQAGGRPAFGQVMGRTAMRCVPFEPFSFFFGKLGWHDSVSKTRVVLVSGI
jgi:uncharacterized RDD family membrane protein YckC